MKGGTLRDFSIPSLSQNPKKLKGGTLWGKLFFRKKSHNAEKNERGPLLDFSIPSLSQKPKKMKGEPFGENFFPKSSLVMPNKKRNGGPFGLVRHCMLWGKLFGSVPWANR